MNVCWFFTISKFSQDPISLSADVYLYPSRTRQSYMSTISATFPLCKKETLPSNDVSADIRHYGQKQKLRINRMTPLSLLWEGFHTGLPGIYLSNCVKYFFFRKGNDLGQSRNNRSTKVFFHGYLVPVACKLMFSTQWNRSYFTA